MASIYETRAALIDAESKLDGALVSINELVTALDGLVGTAPVTAPPPTYLPALDLSNTKLTLPVNDQGVLSDTNDAHEIEPPDDLKAFIYPPFYVPTVNGIVMASPVRPAAYTRSATSGRCEFRHLENRDGTTRTHFRTEFSLNFAPAGAKITCVQIHRTDPVSPPASGSPLIKGSILVAADGQSFSYRGLIKKRQGDAIDFDWDIGFGNRAFASGLLFNQPVSVEVDFNPIAHQLAVSVNNAPWVLFDDVWTDTQTYVKPVGVYPSSAGVGLESDLMQITAHSFRMF